jgi:hypothetical protein
MYNKRPNYHKLISDFVGSYVACSCGLTLITQEEIRDHWQLGHFDYTVDEDEEYLEEINKEIREYSKLIGTSSNELFEAYCQGCLDGLIKIKNIILQKDKENN